MGDPVTWFSPAPDHFSCKSSIHAHSCEQAYIRQEYTSSYVEKPLGDLLQANPDDSFYNRDDFVVHALQIAFSGILCMDDGHVHPFGSDAVSNHDSDCNQKALQHLPQSGSTQKGSDELSVNSDSDAVQLCDGVEELSSIAVDRQSSSANNCIVPIPRPIPPKKLISAMKGGHQQQGMPQKKNLRVTWAPEVYDPPVTSSSHTVKGHHHHSYPKRKFHHKHKSSKGKPSHGRSSYNKHVSRRSSHGTYDPLDARLHSVEPLKGFNQPSLDVLNYPISGLDKCGSSFFLESVPGMHLRVG